MAYSSRADVFRSRLFTLQSRHGINITSCSSRVINRVSRLYGPKNPILRNFTSNTNGELIQALEASYLCESTEVFPNVVLCDELLYSYHDIAEKNQLYYPLLGITDELVLKSTMQYLVSVKQILVLMSLVNLKRTS